MDKFSGRVWPGFELGDPIIMVENFGSYLRNERELRGIPLKEISDSTKIHMRFLQALESNHYDKLPGEVFIKGYIRSYAKTIGTNVEEILAVYDESVGKERKHTIGSPNKQIPRLLHHRKKFRSLLLWIISFLLLVTFFVLAQRFFSSSNIPSPSASDSFHSTQNVKTQPTAAFDAPSTKASDKIIPPISKPSTSLKLSDNKIKSTYESAKTEIMKLEEKKNITMQITKTQNFIKQPVTESGSVNIETPLELTIRSKEKSWYKLVIDGTATKDFILPTGSGKTLRANHFFEVTVGNRKGTQMTLNGKTLVLPISENNILKNYIIQRTLPLD